MLKSIIVLPDGTEISSGGGQKVNIRSTSLTECVNSGEELTIGSVCSNMLEMTLQTPAGKPSFAAGTEIALYKEDTNGRNKVGLFRLEKPTKPSAGLTKIIGYDRVSKLDKDLTGWLNSLTGWPYSLLTFAGMVCAACGLRLVTTSVPNGDYPVKRIQAEATGRQLMGWVGEVCCRFCRANADGDIELAWYTQKNVTISPSGENYYFSRSLSSSGYDVAPIEAVQIRTADNSNGEAWPAVADGSNSYVIESNPILDTTEKTKAALANIKDVLSTMTYTPCDVSIPATLGIHAGDIVQVTDANGVTKSVCVMSKTQKGQKDTIGCTGSQRRDSSTAVSNKQQYVTASQASAIAQGKVDAQTSEEVFNRLTDNGTIQGIYSENGKWYINAEIAQIVNLVADIITAGKLQSKDGNSYFDLDKGEFAVAGGKVGPWSVENVTVIVGTQEAYSGRALTAMNVNTGTRVSLTPDYLYVEQLDSYGNWVQYPAKWTVLAAMAQ